MEIEAETVQPKIHAALHRILTGLAQYQFISRSFLLTSSDKQTAYRALQKGMAQGFIKEYTLANKIGGRIFRSGYYGITGLGLQYLLDHDDMISFGLRGDRDELQARIAESGRAPSLQSEKMARYLSISGTAFLASLMGASTSPIFPPSGQKKSEQTATDCSDPDDVESLPEEMNKAGFSDDSTRISGNNGFVFLNAYEIKRLLAGNVGQYSGYHAGRFTGILESETKSVLVYTGSKGGMSWSKVATKPEFKAHHVYSAKYSAYKNLPGGENHGIMFVQNARSFANLYLDVAHKRKEDMFADQFNSFVIFPVDSYGVINALEYIEIDLADYERQFAEAAIQSGIYKANTSGHTTLFPLKNLNGIPMTIGVFIEGVKLNRLRTIYEKTAAAYGVICYQWQIDFYQRVIPEAIFMTIN